MIKQVVLSRENVKSQDHTKINTSACMELVSSKAIESFSYHQDRNGPSVICLNSQCLLTHISKTTESDNNEKLKSENKNELYQCLWINWSLS